MNLPSSRICLRFFGVTAVLICLASTDTLPSPTYGGSPEPRLESLPPLEAWRKAQVNGKYQMLLRQIAVPEDGKRYADFRDDGPRQIKQYAGHTDLPAGHWVYVYPNWYIWRDLTAAPKFKRGWGPEQATGPPNTPLPGDHDTAWASQTPDNQDEWLLLEYAVPIVPDKIMIYESFNPGAVNRITAFKLTGEEVEVWKGKDPTPTGQQIGVSEIRLSLTFKTNRVRLHVNSLAVPGWNEIDAVGLRDAAGTTHWAIAADASSTFAQPGVGQQIIFNQNGGIVIMPNPPAPIAVPGGVAPGALVPPPAAFPPAPRPAIAGAPRDPNADRIAKLEKEVADLKETLRQLQQQLNRQRNDRPTR